MAAAASISIPAYCFMPDHLHLLVEGDTMESDLRRFMSSFKQKSGYAFSRAGNDRLWQKGYHDRILRTEETTSIVVRYILENPVRAGLVTRFDEYPHTGSDRYSLEELAEIGSQG